MHKKTFLIISPERWQWQYVSKHHYAIALAQKGHKVYFLNPPDNSLEKIEVKKTKYKNLYEINAPQAAKGMRFMPRFLRVWIEKKWLKKLENLINEKTFAVWLFENSRFYNMEFAEDRLKIYHQVDSNQNFHVKEAASSADICFCVTDFIKKELEQYSKRVFKIPHGLSLHLEKQKLSKEQIERFNFSSINAVYIGNLDMKYINTDIFSKLVANHPDISFHFIGSYSANGELFKACKNYKNSIWWGRVESSLIPAILEKADITLLCYKVEDYFEQLSNSHKILEYLYSGKVTVATYTDEYKDKRDLLVMVDDSKEYLQKFKEVIENLEYYNSKEKQELRKAFAKEHSYEKQIEKIFNLIKQF